VRVQREPERLAPRAQKLDRALQGSGVLRRQPGAEGQRLAQGRALADDAGVSFEARLGGPVRPGDQDLAIGAEQQRGPILRATEARHLAGERPFALGPAPALAQVEKGGRDGEDQQAHEEPNAGRGLRLDPIGRAREDARSRRELAELRTVNRARLGQIAANLERHRWLPRTLGGDGGRYVVANVPAFRLTAYEGEKKALEMKVVVGKDYEDRKTPVFADSMQTVVFRPYWNITDSIAAKETWPKIRANPGYMEEEQLETYTEGGKTRLRQKPGEKNSLGLVKFLFPNTFNIYLHDTPSRTLFQKDVRAFSHGCIRLERPAELAAWVLGWPVDSVRRAMQPR